jgi:hypothetical protein
LLGRSKESDGTSRWGWRVGDDVWLLSEVVRDAVKRRLGGEWRSASREFQRQLRARLKETDGRNDVVKKVTSIGRPRVWVLDARVVLGAGAKAIDEPEFQVDDV